MPKPKNLHLNTHTFTHKQKEPTFAINVTTHSCVCVYVSWNTYKLLWHLPAAPNALVWVWAAVLRLILRLCQTHAYIQTMPKYTNSDANTNTTVSPHGAARMTTGNLFKFSKCPKYDIITTSGFITHQNLMHLKGSFACSSSSTMVVKSILFKCQIQI